MNQESKQEPTPTSLHRKYYLSPELFAKDRPLQEKTPSLAFGELSPSPIAAKYKFRHSIEQDSRLKNLE
jgi:hypothetical protein